MGRAKKVCAEPSCPELTDGTRCPKHERAKDKARGTRQARGYDKHHDRMRAAWQRRIDNGDLVCCVTCGTRINPGDEWDLGHAAGRTTYLGPQCIHDNRGHHDPRG